MVSSLREVSGNSIVKLSMFVCLLLATSFKLIFFKEKPDAFSSRLNRLIPKFKESLLNAFSDILAMIFLKLNMLSVKFPRCFFFRQHMIRHPSTTNQDGINTQIKGVFFLHGIFGSKSIQNKLKIRRGIGVSFRRLILNPKSWTLLMDIFPLKKGIISNLADKRVTLSIS